MPLQQWLSLLCRVCLLLVYFWLRHLCCSELQEPPVYLPGEHLSVPGQYWTYWLGCWQDEQHSAGRPNWRWKSAQDTWESQDQILQCFRILLHLGLSLSCWCMLTLPHCSVSCPSLLPTCLLLATCSSKEVCELHICPVEVRGRQLHSPLLLSPRWFFSSLIYSSTYLWFLPSSPWLHLEVLKCPGPKVIHQSS